MSNIMTTEAFERKVTAFATVFPNATTHEIAGWLLKCYHTNMNIRDIQRVLDIGHDIGKPVERVGRAGEAYWMGMNGHIYIPTYGALHFDCKTGQIVSIGGMAPRTSCVRTSSSELAVWCFNFSVWFVVMVSVMSGAAFWYYCIA